MPKLKLSDAIMLNGMTKKQGFGDKSVYSVDAPCAIGGALQAIGKQPRKSWSVNHYHVFTLEWPWVGRDSKCPACLVPQTVRDTIWHLNDTHRWTRQQIAEWVAHVEPQEPGTVIDSLIETAERVCDATICQNIEDEYGYLCGKKCEPGSYVCSEHEED